MKLQDYVELPDAISMSQIARKAGVSRQMLYNYIDTNVPSIKVAYRIEIITGGNVTLYDWINDSEKAAPEDNINDLI